MSNILADGANWTPAGLWDGSKFVFISAFETDVIDYAGTVNAGDVIEFDIVLVSSNAPYGGNPQIEVLVNGASVALIPASTFDPLPASYASDPLPAGATVQIKVYAASGSYGHEMTLTPVIPPPPVYESTVFVYTMSRIGSVGAWSLYEFPFLIDHFCHLDGELYIRSGNDVLRVQPDGLSDYAGDARTVFFDATVQWPWLDFGQPGVLKLLAGFDMVGVGTATVEVGYNQATPAFTAPFDVPPDTVPGMMIPLPIMAPSMSVKLTYAGGQAWELLAMNLYLQDQRLTA